MEAEVKEVLWVYEPGNWRADSRLYKAVKHSTFENLILESNLKNIFSPSSTTSTPPPALQDVTVLYVKAFVARGGPDEYQISDVFKRARNRPSLLIFEDIDSLITKNNRSFYLDEVDGLAADTGIVILATTNHPESLDSAIRDRPS
ncbi:hypothetical protein HKX48_003791 [Thoreauomyces humboldtii]|nr:hypothetical protein HKX48_003791 [Thoreauomyces humboldtii]